MSLTCHHCISRFAISAPIRMRHRDPVGGLLARRGGARGEVVRVARGEDGGSGEHDAHAAMPIVEHRGAHHAPVDDEQRSGGVLLEHRDAAAQDLAAPLLHDDRAGRALLVGDDDGDAIRRGERAVVLAAQPVHAEPLQLGVELRPHILPHAADVLLVREVVVVVADGVAEAVGGLLGRALVVVGQVAREDRAPALAEEPLDDHDHASAAIRGLQRGVRARGAPADYQHVGPEYLGHLDGLLTLRARSTASPCGAPRDDDVRE